MAAARGDHLSRHLRPLCGGDRERRPGAPGRAGAVAAPLRARRPGVPRRPPARGLRRVPVRHEEGRRGPPRPAAVRARIVQRRLRPVGHRGGDSAVGLRAGADRVPLGRAPPREGAAALGALGIRGIFSRRPRAAFRLHSRPPMRRLAALLACAAACTGDPSAPHLARGNVLVNNGKPEEAAAEYREAARLAPRSALPLERLGDVLYDLGRKGEALAAYREAAGRDSGAFTARIGAARVLTDQGKLGEAREELTVALRGQPTNLYLLLSRGNLHQRAGDAKAALRDYETAVHLE